MAERDPFDYLADEFVRATQDSGAFRLEIVAKDQAIERLKEENAFLRQAIKAFMQDKAHADYYKTHYARFTKEMMSCPCDVHISEMEDHCTIVRLDSMRSVDAPVVKP